MPKKLSKALTPLAVKNAKPGRHADGEGLYLVVREGGARAWVFRFMLMGKTRDIGLGSAGQGGISLAVARDHASALRQKVKAGIDPLAERANEAAQALAAEQAAKVAGTTFKQSAEAYIAANEGEWRNDKHRQQWRNTLIAYVYPIMGGLPVADIDTNHVMAVLEPIWAAKPETASRIRGRIEVVLDAAKARGHRKGENPARWRGHVDKMLPKRSKLSRGHHTALPYADLSAFMVALRERRAMAAMALEFAILTAVRTGEALGATWSEIDLDAAVWTIPAERMKAGREHRVPLSPRAVEILKGLKGMGKHHVFPGERSDKLSGMAMSMLLRRMGVHVTVHGFRSTFRDWAAETTGFPHEVCEMALAHTIGNKAEAAYRRGDMFDKRRKLMEAWSTYCAKPKAKGENVTPIRKTA